MKQHKIGHVIPTFNRNSNKVIANVNFKSIQLCCLNVVIGATEETIDTVI